MTAPALAASRVDNRCPLLEPEDYEELDARIQLLLRGEAQDHSLPAIVCDASGARLEWEGKRLALVGRGSLVDEAVDRLDAELHDAERAAQADPRTTEAAAVAAREPVLRRGAGASPPPPALAVPAARQAKRAGDARGGGVALSVETEAPSDDIGFAVGPVFDFAASLGPVVLGGREAFRYAAAQRALMFMDFQAALALGAPFDADAMFGAVTRFGAEWMIAYPDGNSGQSSVVPVVDFGVRAGHNFQGLGLWAGLDVRFRLAQLAHRSSTSIVASDIGLSFSVGGAYLDWSRK